MMMRGHNRAGLRQSVEDLDEYEEYGEDQEEDPEEGYEEEDAEEEEDPKPTKEELEYLELRQRLKEAVRKQMKKESGSVLSQSQEKKKLPYDNYGSFFGPSQPVIAQRVIQEGRSILENQHLASRVLHSHRGDKKISARTAPGSVPAVREQPRKVINELKLKAQKLKDTRDYSFLLSDDAELPSAQKEHTPRNVSAPKSDARSAQMPQKSKLPVTKSVKQVHNGRDENRSVSSIRQMQPQVGHQKLAAGSKTNLAKADPRKELATSSRNGDPRKQLGSNSGNGPGRPLAPKGLPSKMPATVDKKISAGGSKNSITNVHKTPVSKLHSSVPKQNLEQKRAPQEPKAKLISKQPVSSLKHQVKPPTEIASRGTMQVHRPQKKPVRRFSDDDDDEGERAISMIRSMFRYNPNKFAGVDDDDSDMEANFEDILEEEKQSERIARKEDERELRLIEEEERRERLRKEAKKRKLSQR